MEIKPENWFFCELCDTVSYKFDCCKNTACNGGGCDQCKELCAEIIRMINAGKVPAKETVPFHARPKFERKDS